MLAGGGARNLLWSRIIATVLNVPVVIYEGSERGAAYGAARLAMFGSGDVEKINVYRKPRVKKVITPVQEWTDHYQGNYVKFKRIYAVLEPEFKNNRVEV